eukprot:7602823-Heterocapsa_arctica.AAC.1
MYPQRAPGHVARAGRAELKAVGQAARGMQGRWQNCAAKQAQAEGQAHQNGWAGLRREAGAEGPLPVSQQPPCLACRAAMGRAKGWPLRAWPGRYHRGEGGCKAVSSVCSQRQ